jgi:hypothetical protein
VLASRPAGPGHFPGAARTEQVSVSPDRPFGCPSCLRPTPLVPTTSLEPSPPCPHVPMSTPPLDPAGHAPRRCPRIPMEVGCARDTRALESTRRRPVVDPGRGTIIYPMPGFFWRGFALWDASKQKQKQALDGISPISAPIWPQCQFFLSKGRSGGRKRHCGYEISPKTLVALSPFWPRTHPRPTHHGGVRLLFASPLQMEVIGDAMCTSLLESKRAHNPLKRGKSAHNLLKLLTSCCSICNLCSQAAHPSR